MAAAREWSFSQQSFRVDISCGWIDDSQHRLNYIKGGSENGAGQKQGFLNKIDWGTHPSHHLRRNIARRHTFKFHLIECLDMRCARLFDSRSLKDKETYSFLKTSNWGVNECMVSNILTRKETYSFEFGSPHLCVGFLFLILYPGPPPGLLLLLPPPPSHTQPNTHTNTHTPHTCSETSYRITDVECISRAKDISVKSARIDLED